MVKVAEPNQGQRVETSALSCELQRDAASSDHGIVMAFTTNIIPGIKTEVPRNQQFGAGFLLAANNCDVLQLPVVKLPHPCQGGGRGSSEGQE